TFAIFAEQSGGAPLWQETQTLTTDANGRFSALLGAASADGIPAELFAGGEARWLAVLTQAPGAVEQPRILLASVPYALRAADAEMLGGKPAAAYMTANPQGADTGGCAQASQPGALPAAKSASAVPAISASGAKTGALPVFTDSSGDLGDSLLFQSGGNVGVGTSSPVALLSLLGTNPTMRIEQYGPIGSGDSPNFNFYTGNGTAAAPTATQSGDNLGQFAASGYTGSGFPASSKVKVTFVATDTWTTASNGTAISFQTTANTDTTTSRTERMRIDNTGNIGIGTSTPS